jgi:hypothetical protein
MPIKYVQKKMLIWVKKKKKISYRPREVTSFPSSYVNKVNDAFDCFPCITCPDFRLSVPQATSNSLFCLTLKTCNHRHLTYPWSKNADDLPITHDDCIIFFCDGVLLVCDRCRRDAPFLREGCMTLFKDHCDRVNFYNLSLKLKQK